MALTSKRHCPIWSAPVCRNSIPAGEVAYHHLGCGEPHSLSATGFLLPIHTWAVMLENLFFISQDRYLTSIKHFDAHCYVPGEGRVIDFDFGRRIKVSWPVVSNYSSSVLEILWYGFFLGNFAPVVFQYLPIPIPGWNRGFLISLRIFQISENIN